MKLKARQVIGDRTAWSLRALVELDGEDAALLAPESGAEDWEREDAINRILAVAGVQSAGVGWPGGPFAHEPCVRIVRHRAIVDQTGGLDI